jgi:hypothetical protein
MPYALKSDTIIAHIICNIDNIGIYIHIEHGIIGHNQATDTCHRHFCMRLLISLVDERNSSNALSDVNISVKTEDDQINRLGWSSLSQNRCTVCMSFI